MKNARALAVALLLVALGCVDARPAGPGKAVPALTASTFDAAVAGPGPTVVDFWAEWCGPCREMHPVLERANAAEDGKVAFYRVNIDEEAALAERYRVDSIPCFVVFKGGQEVTRRIGSSDEAEFLGWVSKQR